MATPGEIITWIEQQELASLTWDGTQWNFLLADVSGLKFQASNISLSALIDDVQVKIQNLRNALNPGA